MKDSASAADPKSAAASLKNAKAKSTVATMAFDFGVLSAQLRRDMADAAVLLKLHNSSTSGEMDAAMRYVMQGLPSGTGADATDDQDGQQTISAKQWDAWSRYEPDSSAGQAAGPTAATAASSSSQSRTCSCPLRRAPAHSAADIPGGHLEWETMLLAISGLRLKNRATTSPWSADCFIVGAN